MQLKFRLLLAAISFLIISGTNAANVGVAATVNGQKIMVEKLQKAIDSYLQQQGTNIGAIRDPKKYKEIREKILDVIIGQKLLWQSARKDNLVASEEEITELYQKFVSQYPSKEAFETKMKIEGYDEKSYREELRQQLSAKKWVHEKIIKKVKVESAEIHEFYKSNEEKFHMPETVHARHILITLDKKGDKKQIKEARDLLLKLRKQLTDGADFAELARKHSTGPSAPNGGDLGFFPRGKMVKPFEEAAFRLKEGEVSDIVDTRFGYHLIKVEQREPSRTITEKEVSGRIEQYLLRAKSETALNEAIGKLRKEAKIKIYSL